MLDVAAVMVGVPSPWLLLCPPEKEKGSRCSNHRSCSDQEEEEGKKGNLILAISPSPETEGEIDAVRSDVESRHRRPY